MSFRSLTVLVGLLVLAGCAKRSDPVHEDLAPEQEATSDELGPDDPEHVRSVELMLTEDATEALKWGEAHQPEWAPGIKSIYDMGVKTVVIHEYDEEFIGRVPCALIVDRGDVEWKRVQQALWDWMAEQQIRDHGWDTTSRYTVVFLY